MELPWRNTNDPYHIYISEIMLQQTQVKTVLERFYFPFLECFPSLKVLAESPLEEVMHAWQGLGYYTRARNLHKAAIESNGSLPDALDSLIVLPGIGTNTAHAILAFGFHQPYPVLEANVKRLICRLFRIRDKNDKSLWEKAWFLLDRDNPFDYNQAMMDIGNLICLPKTPKCTICPVEAFCGGKAEPIHYPQMQKRTKTKTIRQNIFIFNYQGKIFLQPRAEKLLGGLWGFPESESEEIEFDGKSYHTGEMQQIGEVKHVYSHFTREATLWVCMPDKLSPPLVNSFFSPQEIKNLPTSSLEKKILIQYADWGNRLL